MVVSVNEGGGARGPTSAQEDQTDFRMGRNRLTVKLPQGCPPAVHASRRRPSRARPAQLEASKRRVTFPKLPGDGGMEEAKGRRDGRENSGGRVHEKQGKTHPPRNQVMCGPQMAEMKRPKTQR